MITLYSFGPGFGLPDPSPFVTKAEVLLKMAELPYRTDFHARWMDDANFASLRSFAVCPLQFALSS